MTTCHFPFQQIIVPETAEITHPGGIAEPMIRAKSLKAIGAKLKV
jgi:hypothetical protein